MSSLQDDSRPERPSLTTWPGLDGFAYNATYAASLDPRLFPVHDDFPSGNGRCAPVRAALPHGAGRK